MERRGRVIDKTSIEKGVYLRPLSAEEFISYQLNDRGRWCILKSDLESAELNFKGGITLNPFNHYLFYNRANLRLEKGDFSGALADAQTVLSLDPTYSECYSIIANSFLEQGHIYEATINYLEYLKHFPDSIIPLEVYEYIERYFC